MARVSEQCVNVYVNGHARVRARVATCITYVKWVVTRGVLRMTALGGGWR